MNSKRFWYFLRRACTRFGAIAIRAYELVTSYDTYIFLYGSSMMKTWRDLLGLKWPMLRILPPPIFPIDLDLMAPLNRVLMSSAADQGSSKRRRLRLPTSSTRVPTGHADLAGRPPQTRVTEVPRSIMINIGTVFSQVILGTIVTVHVH